jgi:hypothetical protein
MIVYILALSGETVLIRSFGVHISSAGYRDWSNLGSWLDADHHRGPTLARSAHSSRGTSIRGALYPIIQEWNQFMSNS